MELTQANPASTSVATNVTAQSAQPVISSDFDTFLKMLTAQALYQDPLEPIDSSQYAAQLAQFSMVEQQVLSNDLLTALAAQLGAGNISQMAGFIGMEALSTAPVAFDGNPVTFTPRPAVNADQAFLIVRNEAGNIVQQAELPLVAQPVQWAGVTETGAPFPSGLYSFEIESRSGGEILRSEPAETYTRITEARLSNGTTELVLASGASVAVDSITGLRAPPDGS